MATESDLSRTRDELTDLVSRIGNSVEDTFEQMDDQIENVVMGIIANHGGVNYRIVGVQGNEHWKIEYIYEVLTDFATEKALERIESPSSIELRDQDVEQGRDEMESVFEGFSRADLRVLRSSTTQLLANPPTYYSVETNERGAVIKLTSGMAIFPSSDDFGPRRLREAVQTVVTTGVTAESHLQHSYGIHVEDDEPEPRPEADPANDPSFR